MSLLARTSSLLASLVLGTILVLPAAAVAQSEAIQFRPACDLADDAAASSALGVDVVGDDSISYLYCVYEAADRAIAFVTLNTDLTLPLLRLGFPDVADITVAGQPALSTPGDGSGTLPTVAVALDDGSLMIQVMAEAGIDDPIAAATALGEALLAAGPVTARQPEEASGPAIAFTGDPCTIVSLAELTDIVGKGFISTEVDSTASGCTYQSDLDKDPVFVSLGVSDGTLGSLRSGQSVDMTVADRNAVFWPDMSGLFVDVGGGRLFQVVILAMSQPADGDAQRVPEQAAMIAELAVGRMTPTTQGSEVVAGADEMAPSGDCPLLSLQAVEDTTGMTFQLTPGGSEESCIFGSSDQVASLILGTEDFAGLDAAWEEARLTFTDLPEPTTLDVAGQAAYGGQGSAGAIVVVDLAGAADMDGKVLGVLLFGLPTTGDQVELARRLAEQVLAGM